MPGANEKIEIENVVSPGRFMRVHEAKFEAMNHALLAVLPPAAPGLTLAEVRARGLPLLPQGLFPGGAKAGCWLKAAQLDLEAKATIEREPSKPLRLHRRP